MSDLIKREDAIKAVSIPCGTCLARNIEDCEKCSVPKLRELINAIPSAGRQQGKWIITESYQKGQVLWYDYKCSICGHHRDRRMNYCEICGARMLAKDTNVPNKKGADDEMLR